MPWTSGTKTSNTINILYQEYIFTEKLQYRSHYHNSINLHNIFIIKMIHTHTHFLETWKVDKPIGEEQSSAEASQTKQESPFLRDNTATS